MNTLLESLRSALESIRAHGFRSLLTSLGIIIGVTSVIAVVSIVQGLSFTINAQLGKKPPSSARSKISTLAAP